MIVETQLKRLVEDQFQPIYLQLDNESNQHSVPANSETHFRLVLVSERFAGLRKVARHQLIYEAASELVAGPIHALSMFLYDPLEWRAKEQAPLASPDCLGGSFASASDLGEHKV
ncbi:MAG: BolA/IbaG family iron-sulfur metabolism protein [Pseudomonadota bacterium]